MTFVHQLARSAIVFTAYDLDGAPFRILVIVTTLELDPGSKHYKVHYLTKLTDAARDYLAKSDQVKAFVLVNRPKDWPSASFHRHRASGTDAEAIRQAAP